MLAYWRRYAPAALAAAQGGDERRAMPALQTLARVHNGGPRGARNAATLAYWRRVEAEMKKGER